MEHGPANPPQDPQAVRDGLKVLIDQNRLAEAQGRLRRARGEFSRDPDLATLDAYIQLRLGGSEAAAAAAAEALSLDCDDPLAALVLGTAQRNLGRHFQAAKALLAAHRALPDRVDAACMLNTCAG